MTWMKVDDGIGTHPKMVRALKATGGTGDAGWLWICGLAFARKHSTDGFLGDDILDTVAPGLKGWKRAADALVTVTLWTRVEGGYQIRDYFDWNPSKAELDDEKKAERERKARERAEKRERERLEREEVERLERQRSADRPAGQAAPVRDVSARTLDGQVVGQVEGVRDVSVPHAGAHADARLSSPSPLDSGRSSEGGPGETAAVVIDIGPPAGRAVRGGQVMSSAEYVRLQRYNAFVGGRLRVPHKLHRDFVTALGGDTPDADLQTWYATVDAELERTREAIVPDVWKWLEARFKPWLVERAGDAEMRKFLEGGRGA